MMRPPKRPRLKRPVSICAEFEQGKILDDNAHYMVVLWWHRLIPHRSYVKGWKVGPSHYLGQTLVEVWLDK